MATQERKLKLYTADSRAFFDIYEGAMRLRPSEEDPPNVKGYLDYLYIRKKHPGQQFSRKVEVTPNIHGDKKRKRIGLFDVLHTPAFFDVNRKGQILIPRGERVVDLHIPSMWFMSPKDRVTPQMVTESLSLVGDDIANDTKARFVVGLTHPRIALAAKRWGFEVVDRPLPQDIYELLDYKDQDYPPEQALLDIDTLKNEMLVWQPQVAFVNRFHT